MSDTPKPPKPKFLRIIVRRTVNEREVIGRPRLGEMWFCQSLATNGFQVKSPGFALRTDTGYLVAVAPKEGQGEETYNGNIVILAGEALVIEPVAAGVFDFTLAVLRVRVNRQLQDAGFGISAETYRPHPHAELPDELTRVHATATQTQPDGWEHHHRRRTGAVQE